MRKAFKILRNRMHYLLDAKECKEYVAVLAKADDTYSEYHVYDNGSYVTVNQSKRVFLLADEG